MYQAHFSLLEKWNLCHAAPWRLRSDDLRWNLVGQALLTYSILSVEGASLIYAQASGEGIQRGLSANSLWASLFTCDSLESAKALLVAFDDKAKQLAKKQLLFCGDEFHFFPGIPSNSDCASDQFFMHACEDFAYMGHTYCDFIGSLTENTALAAYAAGAKELAARSGLSCVAANPGKEVSNLTEFLQQNFPGRWSRELNYSPADGAIWTVLENSQKEILGFSRIALRKSKENLGRTISALRLPLLSEKPEPNDSCLGPIGVAEKYRGLGYGKIILGLSLQHLIDANAKSICIDWTDAYQFYSPLGLRKERYYKFFRKSC